MISYKNAIHKDFGKYTIQNDIIVTPFWTNKFCKELVGVCEQFSDRFRTDNTDNYKTEELLLHTISPLLLEDYGAHMRDHVFPLISKEWHYTRIQSEGVYSPYIIRYRMNGCRSLGKHTDISFITLNVKLNDDYKGCDLYFPRQNFSLKDVPVGHAVIWPSLVTHPHYTDELQEGVKYSLTAFSWPPHWNDSKGYRF